MIDVAQQIDAVHRSVSGEGTGETRTVTISQTYAADVEDVWDACTTPGRIARFFLPISGELREGGRFQLEGHAGGTITSCDAPRRFEATWESMGTTSWIAVSLEADGDGRTKLTLDHTVPVDDHWSQFGPGAVGVGWDMLLLGLSLHLGAPDGVVDKDAVAAWMASADGLAFTVRSSEAWGSAHAAAGTEPAEEVAAQAARTLAAYTGEAPPD